MMGFLSSHLCQCPNDLEGKKPAPPPLYIVGRHMGAIPLAPGATLPLSNSTSSSVVLGEALPENCKLHHHAVVLPKLSLNFSSPLMDQEGGDIPGCTCVEYGGAVRSALDRIFRDLNRREYDSLIRVLVTLPLSDLQRYEDAHPLPLLLLESP